MLGIAMNRAGATQAALAAGFLSASWEMKTIACTSSLPFKSLSARFVVSGFPLRVTGPQPSAHANRSPLSSGWQGA